MSFRQCTDDEIKLYKLDLQLFAEDSPTGQKTEDATPRKKQKEREKGNVLKSMEVNTLAIIAAGFISIMILGRFIFENLTKFTYRAFTNLEFQIADTPQLTVLYSESLYAVFFSAGIIFAAVFIAAIVANVAQVGFLLTFEPFKIEFNKFNPASGLKKIFSLKNIMEMFKALGKIIIISYFPLRTIKLHYYDLLNTIRMEMMLGFGIIFEVLTIILWQILFALLIIAIIDFIYQKYEYEKKLKMSKYDVKKEREDMDGKPEIKKAQKRKIQELLRKNMMNELPQADVVVTNPTHYAVAIKYVDESGNPPYVVAKGAFKLAQKIKEIAKDNEVPIIENKPLARGLFKEVELGDYIPEEFFKAVAEILAWAYKVKNKG
ncbi:MAG: flagellar biosynthesis protein FlhB [Candidatus Muiribacteriota bacterium]